MNKNFSGSDNNKSNLIIILAIALIALIGYVSLDFVDTMRTNSNKSYLEGVKTRYERAIHYRFAAIYNGPSTEAHHGTSAMVPSVSFSSTGYQSHRAASSATAASAAAAPAASSAYASYAGGGSAISSLQSNASAHSYGGGSSIGGGMSTGASSSSHGATSGAIAMASPSTNFIGTLPRASKSRALLTEDAAPARSGAPRRISSTEGDGTEHGEKSDDGKWWNQETWEWQDTDPLASGGSHLGEAGAPLGDAPILLILLLCGAYAALAAYRRRQAAA